MNRLAIAAAVLLFIGGCEKADDMRRSAAEKIEEADLRKEIEEIYEKVIRPQKNQTSVGEVAGHANMTQYATQAFYSYPSPSRFANPSYSLRR